MLLNTIPPRQRFDIHNRLFSTAHVVDRIRFRPRSSPKDLDCWIFRPMHQDVGAAPLIAVHGIRRRGREQVELLADRGRSQGRVVIAPIFDAERWPRYQQAVIRGRADKALLRLWSELQAEGLFNSDRFILTGFSGGAQFAHRFAMLHPQKVERLIISSAGWYSFPDDAEFPYGLTNPAGRQATKVLRKNLPAFLAIPITVTVGDRDNRLDPNTRSGDDIDRQQGLTRLERAVNWTRALSRLADRMNVDAQIKTVTLPRCGHSFRRCVRIGGLDRLILPGSGVATRQKRLSFEPTPQCLDIAA
jgi:pimeloyl-ACP methyl ester carboxylesterase